MIKNIDSVQNSLVKETAELLQKKYRDKQQVFLVEGLKSVQEALLSKFIVEKIFLVSDNMKQDDFVSISKLSAEKQIELFSVTEKIIAKISDTKTPQPIVAVVQKPQLKLEYLKLTDKNCVVILDELQDPGNLGTIIRTADAAGMDAVFLTTDCVDLYAPKVVRSTMGSLFHLPLFVECEKKTLLAFLQDNGFTIYTTAANATSNIFTTDFASKCAVVIGNEAHGISEVFSKAADVELFIPIKGKAESLNAAVAAALVMYQVSEGS